MKNSFLILSIILFLLSCSKPSVTIKYENGSQFEIVSASGIRIILDAVDLKRLAGEPTEENIVLVTHTHPDHYKRDFADTFSGQKLLFEPGTIEKGDVKITSIPASHDNTQLIKENGSSNYLFLIETGGLRIVHMGDIGQEKLTPEQLQILGKIDVMITQTENSFSNMNMQNKKGFQLIDQVNPSIVLFTHSGEQSYKYAKENFSVMVSKYKDELRLNPSSVSGKTKVFILMGVVAPAYQKLMDLKTF